MNKAIELATIISKSPDNNYTDTLKEYNLYSTFQDIYSLNLNLEQLNLLVAFIIFAYDPDSLRLDIRKDRFDNKVDIMLSLNIDTNEEIIQPILTNENETFNHCVLNYLEKLTNWRWPTIYSLLDYHSSMIRFANQKTESEKRFDKITKDGEVKEVVQDYDIESISKVNIQKSEIFNRAIKARRDADELLEDIRKEFMIVDTVVQQDLGFTFSETAKKKVDILSWRTFIRDIKEKKLASGI